MTLFSLSSRSSVGRAPDRCSGVDRFDSLGEDSDFFLSHARVMLINSLLTSLVLNFKYFRPRSFH